MIRPRRGRTKFTFITINIGILRIHFLLFTNYSFFNPIESHLKNVKFDSTPKTYPECGRRDCEISRKTPYNQPIVRLLFQVLFVEPIVNTKQPGSVHILVEQPTPTIEGLPDTGTFAHTVG